MEKRVPEIRFQGFEGPWEKKKLEELIILGNGRDYKHLQYGNIPVYGTGGYMTSVNDFLSDKDSIGIGRKGTIDKPYILKAPFWTVDTLFYATPKDEIDLSYLFGLFQIIDWKSKDESTGVPSLSKQNIKDIELYSTCDTLEQRKIGSFFTEIDDLITLNQQKLDKLKTLKKSCLEKMFPKEGSLVPEVRFAGFTEPWRKKRLRVIAERVVRKNTNNESNLPLTISAQFGLVDQITFFNNRVASRDVSNYYLVYKGEFAYNKSSSDGYPFGVVKRLNKYDKGVLSTLYIVFALKSNTEVDSDFLSTFFDTDRWYKDVAERAEEGARNHGLLNITAEDFFDTEIIFPNAKEEQLAISSYLNHLNHLIALHNQKLEKLKNLKKACLEKMFA